MNGIFLIGVPEDTVAVIKMIASKTGKSHADIIADGLALLARHVLAKQEVSAESKATVTKRTRP